MSALFLAMLISTASAADSADSDLILNGPLTQGGMVIGQTQPGAAVQLNGRQIKVSNNGTFVIGFGRDAPTQANLEIKLPNGAIKHRKLKITQRKYDVQRIDNLAVNLVSPPPEVHERIRNEAGMARNARAHGSAMPYFSTRFKWPVEGIITGVYGVRRILNGQDRSPHYGIDIAATKGTPVKMPAGGRVVLIHDMYFSGKTMIVDHGYGVFSTFLHLDQTSAKVGDFAEQGQTVGTVGATGRVTGPHLDWRVNWFNERLDPQLLVGKMPAE